MRRLISIEFIVVSQKSLDIIVILFFEILILKKGSSYGVVWQVYFWSLVLLKRFENGLRLLDNHPVCLYY